LNQISPLVGAPLTKTLFRMAVPGVIGALLYSCLGLVEANYLRQAGTDVLAAVAVVFPLVMLAAMFSAGALGGAVSGRTARALGAGKNREASAVLVSAVLISLVGGLLMWVLVVQLGPLLYSYASDSDTVRQAAQQYAIYLFPAMPAFWLVNMLCSVMRGSGDMVRPAIVAGVMVIAYAVVGAWLIPKSNASVVDSVKAAALSMICAYLLSLLLAIFYIGQSRQPIRFHIREFRWHTLAGILQQGLLASSQSVMTITYAMITTILFSRHGTDWLAGYGLAVRLELIMVPVIFGIGASLIAIVGAYVGAGQRRVAILIAWRGMLINATLVGFIGLWFSLFPTSWCSIVGSDEAVIAHCNHSLRVVAPTYAFLALGLGGYFASQGLNTLMWPVLGALLRLTIVATGIFWVTSATSINAVLLLVVFAVIVYGVFIAITLKIGPWRHYQ